MQQVFIHQKLLKTSIYLFKIWCRIKSKADKLDVDKLEPVPVDLNKLSDAVKNVVKEDAIMLKSKIFHTKYLILLTELLM